MTEPTEHKSASLLRHSIFLFVTTQVANVCTMLFQFVTGRKLPVEEYGILAAMMSIFLIVSMPLEALRTSMAHFATRANRRGDLGAIRWLVNTWSRRMVLLAAGLLIGSYLLRDQAAVFFQLDSGMPFVFATGIIAITLFTPLMTGVFQGVQNFYWMSVSMHTWAVTRLLLVTVFVMVVPTAEAGLAAHALAAFLGIVLSFVGLHRMTKGHSVVAPESGIGGYFFRSLFMLAGYAVLMNADLIFVKHLFTPEETGEFARAAIIARSVIFLPMPIALAMFPKVISSGPSTRDSRLTLLRAAGMVSGLIGSAVAAVFIVPWLPIWIMYGIRHPDASTMRLLVLMVAAMAPLALTYLLMNYEMAQHRFRLAWLLGGCAIAYIGGVILFHDTMEQVVWVLGAVSSTSAVGFAAVILARAGLKQHRQHTEAT